MYFATLTAATGQLTALQITPMQIRNFTLNKPSSADAGWMRDTIERVSASYGTHVELTADGTLSLRWEEAIRRSAPGAKEQAR
jgi:poly-gamma-glutamate synthesis protein (capsule biosynthesis protein)